MCSVACIEKKFPRNSISSMSGSCNTSLDCGFEGTSLLCFERAAFSDQRNFCKCSIWYGWNGENCDETSGLLIYNRVFFVTATVLSLIVSILLLRTLILNIIVEKNKGVRIFYMNIFWMGVFFSIAAILFTMSLLFQSFPFFNPQLFKFIDQQSYLFTLNSITDIEMLTTNTYMLFRILSFTFFCLGYLYPLY